MQDYRKLKVWERALGLAVSVYRQTVRFPPDERYGLRSQLRRAAVSVPLNVAEGSGRATRADFARCLDLAMGSACELECCLMITRRLDYLDQAVGESLLDQASQVKRMLAALIARVRSAQ